MRPRAGGGGRAGREPPDLQRRRTPRALAQTRSQTRCPCLGDLAKLSQARVSPHLVPSPRRASETPRGDVFIWIAWL